MSRLFDVAQTAGYRAPSQRGAARKRSLAEAQAGTNDVWLTPQWFFDDLNREFQLELDAAALPWNAKCERYWTPDHDGLAQPWAPFRTWVNPPYSHIELWTAKALEEQRGGALIVMLLPARTDSRWWHRDVWGQTGVEVRWIRGRLSMARTPDGEPGSASFAQVVVIWRPA